MGILIFGFSAAAELPRSIFIGLQQMKADLTSRVSEKLVVLMVVLILVLGLGISNLPTIMLGILAATLVGIMPSWWMLKNGVAFVQKPRIKNDSWLWRASFPLAVSILLISIYVQLPVILLSRFNSIETVGLYNAALNTVIPFTLIGTAFASATLPLLSNIYLTDKPAFSRAFSQFFTFSIVLGLPLAALIAWFGENLLLLLFGSEFLQASPLVRLFAWYLPTVFMNMFLFNVLIAIGAQKLSAWLNLLNLVMTIVIGYAFIPRSGAVGAVYTVLLTAIFSILIKLLILWPRIWPKYNLRSLFRLRTLQILLAAGLLSCILIPGSRPGYGKAGSLFITRGFVTIDKDHDGHPEQATWLTDLSGQKVRITVHDGGKDMLPSDEWQNATDFSNDTWVFDYLDDGSVELVAQFRTEPAGELSAYLWDDQNNDGEVNTEAGNDQFQVIESPFPTLIVSTIGSWTQADGSLNPDLVFKYDGIAPNLDFVTKSIAPALTGVFKVDGVADFSIRLVDSNKDGAIDFSHNQILSPIPTDYGAWRNTMKVNSAGIKYTYQTPAFFWPLLNFDSEYDVKNYFSTPAFVDVDWQHAKILDFGVTGYPIEQGFHINNVNPWEENKVNQAAFENAMAYYDLAGNQNGLPELFIRHVYWPSHDSIHIPNASMPINEIRYSWRLADADRPEWDFGLSLLGSQPILSTESFTPYTLQVVPYDLLPNWVIDKSWVNATLVAIEDREYLSTEGIYEWSTIEGVVNDVRLPYEDPRRFVKDSYQHQSQCFSGGNDCDLSTLYTDIGVGMRGEYAQLEGKVIMYHSPLDHRLHLFGAHQGVWRIDEDNIIRYYDHSGDGYIDTWENYRGEEIVARLIQSDEHLVLAQYGALEIKSIKLPAEDFLAPPPVDHAAWVNMRRAVQVEQGEIPNTLAQMFESIPVKSTRLVNATIDQVGFNRQGLQFKLILQPGFMQTEPGLLPLENKNAGNYFVIADEDFQVLPYSLQTVVLKMHVADDNPAVDKANIIILHLENTGISNTIDLLLEVKAVQGDKTIILEKQLIALPGGSEKEIRLNWHPVKGGEWTIQASLDDQTGNVLASSHLKVGVEALTTQLLPLTTPSAAMGLSMLFLLSISFLLGGVIFKILR
jgi:O-antigen/teichoic acid export membrane protein